MLVWWVGVIIVRKGRVGSTETKECHSVCVCACVHARVCFVQSCDHPDAKDVNNTFSHLNKTLQHADMPSQKRILISSQLSLPSAPCFLPVFCVLFLLCVLLRTCHLSFKSLLESVRSAGAGGWMDAFLRKLWFSHWAVSDYLYKNRKISHCPYPCHFSQFILFTGLVVTLDSVCDLCLLFVLKEWWLVLISRVFVRNTLPVQLLICPPLFFSTLSLSPLLFLTSVSILMHCFPTEFVHLIKRLTHWTGRKGFSL